MKRFLVLLLNQIIHAVILNFLIDITKDDIKVKNKPPASAGGLFFKCFFADIQSVIYDAQEKPPWGMQDPPPDEAKSDASVQQANVDIFRETLSL